MIRFLKLAPLVLLAMCAGCASLRSWGDQDLLPGPPPVVGIAAGAVTNAGLIALQRPWWQRVIVVTGVSYVGRFTPLIGGHKNAEWHLEFAGGVMVSEVASWFVCSGPCEARRNRRAARGNHD